VRFSNEQVLKRVGDFAVGKGGGTGEKGRGGCELSVWGADLIPGPSPEGEGGSVGEGKRVWPNIGHFSELEERGDYLRKLCMGRGNLFEG
jgi:hypothetical protein